MRRDDAYLLDILIAARKALRFLEGMTWEEFEQSELHQNAVVHLLEITGEAARQPGEGIEVHKTGVILNSDVTGEVGNIGGTVQG